VDGEILKLIKEDISQQQGCSFCREALLGIGETASYGAVVVYKVGNSNENGWFATLSPKTGGNPAEDFTIQLMPFAHLTHFSQLASYEELAKNYGIAFSKISEAMSNIMAEDKGLKATADSRQVAISIATYGKCTTWKEKKEHLHIKIFPFRGSIGQPYTVDSSFLRKQVFKDAKTGKEFVKMEPVRKKEIGRERFRELSERLIRALMGDKQ
jgi:hypothetical protein